jgi:metal-dependent amidase/aminoacylase/carboxypeptidase family protein
MNKINPITKVTQTLQNLEEEVNKYGELTKNAAVISVSVINGGVRSNIIPEEVNDEK